MGKPEQICAHAPQHTLQTAVPSRIALSELDAVMFFGGIDLYVHWVTCVDGFPGTIIPIS